MMNAQEQVAFLQTLVSVGEDSSSASTPPDESSMGSSQELVYYHCVLCDAELPSWPAREDHHAYAHDDGTRRHWCPSCGVYWAPRLKDVKAHRLTCPGPGPGEPRRPPAPPRAPGVPRSGVVQAGPRRVYTTRTPDPTVAALSMPGRTRPKCPSCGQRADTPVSYCKTHPVYQMDGRDRVYIRD